MMHTFLDPSPPLVECTNQGQILDLTLFGPYYLVLYRCNHITLRDVFRRRYREIQGERMIQNKMCLKFSSRTFLANSSRALPRQKLQNSTRTNNLQTTQVSVAPEPGAALPPATTITTSQRGLTWPFRSHKLEDKSFLFPDSIVT